MKHEIASMSAYINDGRINVKFEQRELDNYLNAFGEKGKDELLKNLAYMQYKVIKSWVDKDKEDSQRIEVEII